MSSKCFHAKNPVLSRSKIKPRTLDRPHSGLWPHTPRWTLSPSNSIILLSNRSGLVPNLLGYMLLVFSYKIRARSSHTPHPIPRIAVYGIHRIAVYAHTPRYCSWLPFCSRFDSVDCPDQCLTYLIMLS